MAQAAAVAAFEQGWLGSACRLVSPNCDARPPQTPIELVVIHAISLPPDTYGGHYIDDLFMNRLDCRAHPYFAALDGIRVSAHFLVARDGRLSQYVSLHERAWHAGVSAWRGRTACNDFSIGIELEGSEHEPFAEQQYVVLGDLLAALKAELPLLEASRLVGHSDIAPGRKTDPGPCFDWPRVRRSVAT